MPLRCFIFPLKSSEVITEIISVFSLSFGEISLPLLDQTNADNSLIKSSAKKFLYFLMVRKLRRIYFILSIFSLI